MRFLSRQKGKRKTAMEEPQWGSISLLLMLGYILIRAEAALDRYSWRWCVAKVVGDVIHGTGRSYAGKGLPPSAAAPPPIRPNADARGG